MKISFQVKEYLLNWKDVGIRKENLWGILNTRTKVLLFG